MPKKGKKNRPDWTLKHYVRESWLWGVCERAGVCKRIGVCAMCQCVCERVLGVQELGCKREGWGAHERKLGRGVLVRVQEITGSVCERLLRLFANR
jgi:hypothetical protein